MFSLIILAGMKELNIGADTAEKCSLLLSGKKFGEWNDMPLRVCVMSSRILAQVLQRFTTDVTAKYDHDAKTFDITWATPRKVFLFIGENSVDGDCRSSIMFHHEFVGQEYLAVVQWVCDTLESEGETLCERPHIPICM